MTNNFLIKREVLEAIKFDERLSGYGHEDTLFGYQLVKNGIEITHIDNPILNGDIETNETFLEKTKQGVKNLIYLNELFSSGDEFIKSVKLLNKFHKTKSFHWAFRLFDAVFGKVNYYFLKNGVFTLKMFDLYKISLLVNYQETKP